MNAALHPSPTTEASAPVSWSGEHGDDRLVARLSLLYGGLLLILLALLGSPLAAFTHGWGAVGASTVLLPLAGLLATLPLATARMRRSEAGADRRLASLARRPQGIIVPALAGCAIALALWSRPASLATGSAALAAGGAAIVLGFPLLLAERIMAATPGTRLLEAANLRSLLFVPALLTPLAGLLEIGAALGVPWMRAGMDALALFAAAVAAELTVRSLANWFLPPPAPEQARASVGSLVALLLQPGRLAPDGLAAPIRTHLGLDFSRSWALRFARSASLPIGFALALIAWGLSGVSLIALDRRGIYERFGKPEAVWAPGAHLGLPWPLGRVRLLDLGVIHAVALGGDAGLEPASPAEAAAPAAADRLWAQTHPAEVAYLLASRESDGRQGFQTISVDLKVLYRIGLDDASALRAAYAVEAPDALVRAEAGRLAARVFAGKTLSDVLGAGRELLADGLNTRLQAALDELGSGIELAGVVIEAIHPPPGAAEAYHNVQAAEIIANTAISTERGRALANAARARQQAADLTLTAQAAAAETVGQANVSARTFAADREASDAGGSAFLLERYFGNVAAALIKTPLVIVDHRLTGADAPAIDLRAFGAPPTRPAGDE